MGDFVGVKVDGLKELRKQARKANADAPKQMTRALKEAGKFLKPKIKANVPKRRGTIAAKVGSALASGTKGRIKVNHPAAAVAEFAKQGNYGATMTARYGSVPRYGYKTLKDNSQEVEDRLYKELKEVLTLNGWAR